MRRFVEAVLRAFASFSSAGRGGERQTAGGGQSTGPSRRGWNAATESVGQSEIEGSGNPHEVSGLKKYALGEYENAVEDFDRAIALEPENAGAYVMRAIMKDNLGRFEEAMEDFSLALNIEPDNGEIYVNRGVTRHRFGETESALSDLDRAVLLQPDSAPGFFNRALSRQVSARRKGHWPITTKQCG